VDLSVNGETFCKRWNESTLYRKDITVDNKPAYMYLSAEDGISIPTELTDAVLIGTYDAETQNSIPPGPDWYVRLSTYFMMNKVGAPDTVF
jgi:hypothetical protein